MRVNPDFELKSSGMKMGGGPKQFGVDAERVPEMLARIGSLDLDFQGFHIFSGSQNLRAEAIMEAQREDDRARAAGSPWTRPRRCACSTSAAASAYPTFPASSRSTSPRSARTSPRLLDGIERRLPQAKVVIELGRYLVGEAGIYVCRVIDRKISRGHVFLVTDGGLHHHLAASGNFGQVIRKNYPVVGRQPRARQRARDRLGRRARCARRSICSPTAWRWRRPTWAT